MSAVSGESGLPAIAARLLKQITLKPQNDVIAAQLQTEFALHPIVARVAAARGFQADGDFKNFLSPTLREGLPDPLGLKNLSTACAAIARAVREGRSIAICCDFDVDGLSGGAQVFHFLKVIGANAQVFVPDRFSEGYGLNADTVRKIAQAGFSLLITIDFGTTNVRELLVAREVGLETIVIDHHHCAENPPADIFVNPQQIGCGFANGTLSASGLSWFLLVGLKNTLSDHPIARTIDVRSYLDLACLGTICDMVPLIGANRVIAKRGLEILQETTRPGLQALKAVAGVKREVSCYHVSFGLGPRLNAAGRMVHGEVVIELLTTGDMHRAEKIADRLNRLNMQRKELEDKIKKTASERVRNAGAIPAAIMVWDKSFHTGVIGIVAQRMVEEFFRPAAIMGQDSPGIFKGSVRGIPGFSVIEALSMVQEHLMKFGGHAGAGGFSVAADKVDAFAEAFRSVCAERTATLGSSPLVKADTEVTLAELSIELVEELRRFSPFGIGNSSPQLLVKRLKVGALTVMKGCHLKARLSDGKKSLTGMLWKHAEHPALRQGAEVDVVFRLDINEFKGERELQAHLEAILPAA